MLRKYSARRERRANLDAHRRTWDMGAIRTPDKLYYGGDNKEIGDGYM